MGRKTWAEPGISKLKSVFFDLHQKYMFILTDIHTYDSVYLNVYLQAISKWNI